MIKRIHVRYRLRVGPSADRAAISRVLGFHASHCPVARTIGGCVAISTELDLEET